MALGLRFWWPGLAPGGTAIFAGSSRRCSLGSADGLSAEAAFRGGTGLGRARARCTGDRGPPDDRRAHLGGAPADRGAPGVWATGVGRAAAVRAAWRGGPGGQRAAAGRGRGAAGAPAARRVRVWRGDRRAAVGADDPPAWAGRPVSRRPGAVARATRRHRGPDSPGRDRGARLRFVDGRFSAVRTGNRDAAVAVAGGGTGTERAREPLPGVLYPPGLPALQRAVVTWAAHRGGGLVLVLIRAAGP